MEACFLCDAKLHDERIRVCSSVTPHSNMHFPDKIAELMGGDFVVITTPADHMCKKCSSLLIYMDKLENDLKLVNNALLLYIKKKCGILAPDEPVKTLEVVNYNMKTNEQVEKVDPKKTKTSTTARENAKMLNSHKNQSLDKSPKLKIYKCGFCAHQSEDLEHVRLHVRNSHGNKRENEKHQTRPAALPEKADPPLKKLIYKCQVCDASFDKKENCLDHIKKDHNQSMATVNEEEKSEDTLKFQDNQQEEPMNVGNGAGQQEINNHVEIKETAELKKSQKTDKQHNLKKSFDQTPEESELKVLELAQNIEDNENNTDGDLDVLSMLAAIHSDNP